MITSVSSSSVRLVLVRPWSAATVLTNVRRAERAFADLLELVRRNLRYVVSRRPIAGAHDILLPMTLPLEPNRRYTVEEYLELEGNSQEAKIEFRDGFIVDMREAMAMAGGSPAHSLITANVISAIGTGSGVGRAASTPATCACAFRQDAVHLP